VAKILCIDNCEDILDNLCELLTLEGYQPISATNGRLGIQIAILEIPDFIICNIQMPIINGYRLVQVIRAFPRTRHIPFLFLSAHASKLAIKKGIDLGADYYVTKPYSMVKLLSILKTHRPSY